MYGKCLIGKASNRVTSSPQSTRQVDEGRGSNLAHQCFPVFPLLLVCVGEAVTRHVSEHHLRPEKLARDGGIRCDVDEAKTNLGLRNPAGDAACSPCLLQRGTHETLSALYVGSNCCAKLCSSRRCERCRQWRKNGADDKYKCGQKRVPGTICNPEKKCH